MGYRVCRVHSVSSLLLPVVWAVLAAGPAAAFDLNGLLAVLNTPKKEQPCPAQCTCNKQRAEDLMQNYVTWYLPYMGANMDPGLETQTRYTISFMTAWLGFMADIECHLKSGERINLTDIIHSSRLSFKALRLTCDEGASVIWDLSPIDAFINVLDISGCSLEVPPGRDELAVPLNLWLLHLERVPLQDAESLDFSSGAQLLALAWTHSNLTSLPPSWSQAFLPRMLLLFLAHNQLTSFNCELKVTQLKALNLDHNELTELPSCVLDGSRYTSVLSVNHNHLQSLEQLTEEKLSGNENARTRQRKRAEGMRNEGADKEAKVEKAEEKFTFPYVSYLDVSHNQISYLPPLGNMQQLLGLDVSGNILDNISPIAFTLHPTLHWLDLSNNQLLSLPDGLFNGLVFVRHLNLSHNKLYRFDFDQSPLSSELVDLDLRYNRLAYPPFSDTGYVAPRQSQITAANNPYMCDCKLGSFVEFMNALNEADQKNWFSLGYWDWSDSGRILDEPFADTEQLTCGYPKDMKGQHLVSLNYTTACRVLHGCPVGCRCELVSGPNRTLQLFVDCSRLENLKELPQTLPIINNASVILRMNWSGLRRIDHRPYLRYVKELHAGYSKVSAISPGAMEAMQNITVLSLHNNLLRSLPKTTKNLSLPKGANISLGHNPWTCGCYDLWMPRWLQEHSGNVYNMNGTRCHWTGKLVTKLKATDLNCGVFTYLPMIIALSMLLAVLVILASVLVKYRLEVLVFLYTRFGLRPFDMYKYNQNRTFLFDVFVSFSQHDYRWVVEQLVERLENKPRPRKLCIHLRDFPVGAPITESISWAMSNSQCTLLVLTRDFLSSEWCRHEFRSAHARLLKDPQAKVLVVIHGPLDARMLDRELMAYLRTHSYLRTEDEWFWSKLQYALPKPHTVSSSELMPSMPLPALPPIEVDTFLPNSLAAGDVSPKPHSSLTKTYVETVPLEYV